MNCKPGDLAVVARLTAEDLLPHMGKIVRCLRVSARYSDSWHTEPELERGRTVYDGALSPLRDPGDDAKDETLEWLPVPSREEVSA